MKTLTMWLVVLITAATSLPSCSSQEDAVADASAKKIEARELTPDVIAFRDALIKSSRERLSTASKNGDVSKSALEDDSVLDAAKIFLAQNGTDTKGLASKNDGEKRILYFKALHLLAEKTKINFKD